MRLITILSQLYHSLMTLSGLPSDNLIMPQCQ